MALDEWEERKSEMIIQRNNGLIVFIRAIQIDKRGSPIIR